MQQSRGCGHEKDRSGQFMSDKSCRVLVVFTHHVRWDLERSCYYLGACWHIFIPPSAVRVSIFEELGSCGGETDFLERPVTWQHIGSVNQHTAPWTEESRVELSAVLAIQFGWVKYV
jgi:hypothetical protein